MLKDSIEVKLWTNEEKEALEKDGAVIYLATGQTIREQTDRPFWYLVKRSHGFDENSEKRLLDTPSRLTHVAIYPSPLCFFVPNSIKSYMPDQQELMAVDLENTINNLGMNNLSQEFPEASEAWEVIFQHFDKTGEMLLDMRFQPGCWMRTKTVTIESESYYPHKMAAIVGPWHPEFGLAVDHFGVNDRVSELGTARWLTPKIPFSMTPDQWEQLKSTYNPNPN